jgi:hypothetical protein
MRAVVMRLAERNPSQLSDILSGSASLPLMQVNSERQEKVMQVKFLAGPKQGKTEHIANDAGRALVAAGLAEEIKPKTMDEFFRQHPTGAGAPVQYFETAVWDIAAPGDEKKFVLRRRFQSETDYVTDLELAKHLGCPPELAQRYANISPEQKPNLAIDTKKIYGAGLHREQ